MSVGFHKAECLISSWVLAIAGSKLIFMLTLPSGFPSILMGGSERVLVGQRRNMRLLGFLLTQDTIIQLGLAQCKSERVGLIIKQGGEGETSSTPLCSDAASGHIWTPGINQQIARNAFQEIF